MNRRTRQSGAAVVTALIVATIIAGLLAAAAVVAGTHYQRSRFESDYASALYLAEAGINFEFRKLSDNPALADQISDGSPQGNSYNFGGGTFRVYCANQDGTTPWVAPNPLYVFSTGTFNGLSRTVRAEGQGKTGESEYTIYGISKVTAHSNFFINGTVGTNGRAVTYSTSSISGGLHLNGPGTTVSGNPISYTVKRNAAPVIWQTVDQIAESMFPGGLSYLATYNDNALVPQIVDNKINTINEELVTFLGKAGGAHYYLEDAYFNSSTLVVMDNRTGPITIWTGPSGGPGTIWFNSQTTIKSLDPANRVRFYHGTTGMFRLTSSWNSQVGIYAYNVDPETGKGYGKVWAESTFEVNGGSVIGWDVEFKSTTTVNHPVGPSFFPHVLNRYGFDKNYQELGRPQ